MGQRGPKPQPVETLKLIGSRHAYDRKGEPPILAGDPEPPEWLCDEAVAQWNRMVPRLRGMCILSPGWRESLAQFCHWWVLFERVAVESQTAPATIEGPKGGRVVNPVLKALSEVSDKVLKLGCQFGYTPASKADVRISETPQGDDGSEFFKGVG